MNYLLVTPAYNEMEGLPELVAAMQAQDVHPALWLVMDDFSTDGSFEWLKAQAKAIPWMEVVQPEGLAPSEEYLGHHIAELKSWGMRTAIALAEEKGLDYHALGVLDADILCPPEHYATLCAKLEDDARLGVVSSIIESVYPDGAVRVESSHVYLPRGGTQFFRRACFEQIGGLPPWMGYDGIANARARMQGWRLRLYPHLRARQRRPTATRFGAGQGFARKGKYAWFLDMHPVMVALSALKYSASPPRSAGFHFFKAYAEARRQAIAQCPDERVRHYYRYEKWKERFKHAWHQMQDR